MKHLRDEKRWLVVWQWLEVGMYAAAPVLLLKVFIPSLAGWLVLGAYTVAVVIVLVLVTGPERVRHRKALRRSRGCCEDCGYDLRGCSNLVCPECGKEHANGDGARKCERGRS